MPVVTDDAVEKHVRKSLRKLGIHGSISEHRRMLAVLAFLQRTAE